MAGGELTGMGSLEEILLQAASDAPENVQYCNKTEKTKENTEQELHHESECGQVYAIDMDISERMGVLKSRAAEALHLDAAQCRVTVLGDKQLVDEDTLQEQCGTRTGLVQIQFTVQRGDAGHHIDILDVLKPNEEVSEGKSLAASSAASKPGSPPAQKTKTTKAPKTTRWIVCPTFKEMQRLLKIPQNPLEWSGSHVRQWLSWAVCQFGLTGINVQGSHWGMSGRTLFQLTQTEFRKLVPDDPGDVFFMHFELLRRTNVVAVVCDPNSLVPKPAPPKIVTPNSATQQPSTGNNKETSEPVAKNSVSGSSGSSGSSSSAPNGGGSQQIQLWQFLLELLTEPKLYPVISWYGCGGEFRLHQPEVVAGLWGQRKGKPNMNYEKLSRALRYYYDGDMISKVSGKRFVYKFVMDLKSVVGYSADELRREVEEYRTREGFSLEVPAEYIQDV